MGLPVIMAVSSIVLGRFPFNAATHAYIPLHIRWPRPAGRPSDQFIIRDDDSETHSTHCHTHILLPHNIFFLAHPSTYRTFFSLLIYFLSLRIKQTYTHASSPFANMLVTCNIKTSTGRPRTTNRLDPAHVD